MADILSHSTLKTSLAAYWQLEEASGTRYDAHASFNLTDNNTVTQGTGKIGNCADLESTNNEYLSVASDTTWDLTTTNDRSLSMWIKTESDITSQGLCVRWSNEGGNNKNLLIRLSSSGYVQMYVGSGSATGVNVTGSTDVSDQAWHHVVITWSGSVDDKFRIYVDGSLDATSATASPGAATSTLRFGGYTGGSGTPFDGLMDEIGWWTKALSSSEVTDLYNSGAGLPYIDASDVANSYLDTNLVSYWELEEASGTRVDSKGSNNLADNNTVGQGTGIQGSCGDFESGNSEYLSISDASQTGIDSTTAYSIQTWVKFESLSANMSPISKGNDSGTGLFQVFWLTSNNIVFRRVTASGSPGGREGITHSWTPSTGTWYHLVFTFSTTNGSEMYIDGSSVATDTATDAAIDTTEQFTIGCRSRNGGTAIDMYFDGLIDEVGFWDREITAGEVSALYNGGTSIPYEAAAAATFTPKTVMF